jgi:hypothetical protein
MINQDEVFVISEEDILKPGDTPRGKASAKRRASLFSFPGRKNSAGRGGDPERTSSGTPTSTRRPGAHGPNPAAAGSLSLFVWGLGQFYNRDFKLATLFLLAELQVLAFHYLLFMTWGSIRRFAGLFFLEEWELLLYASSIDFCLIFFLIYNVAQAYRGAEARGGEFNGLHMPVISGTASMLVPGWGQILNGQLGKGSLFLFAFLLQIYCLVLYLHSPFYRVMASLDAQQLLLARMTWVGMGVLFVTALAWIISVYDAVVVAHYTRRLEN